MSLACGKCPKVKSDCYLPHCVAANGVPRGITTINRMIPGPSIQVCQGDKIVVDLKNHLPSDSASIHWHGMRQKGTQYYDGIPLITQCPIGPGETFRYQFYAEDAGTFFYHSHSGFQKQDGPMGPLIIRENPNKEFNFHFDEDLPEHVMLIQDWLNFLVEESFPGDGADRLKGFRAPSYLINGRGIFTKKKKSWNKFATYVGSKNQPPVTTFNVKQNKTYRFRVINGGSIACHVSVFIQSHRLTLVGGEGDRDIEPTTVDTINVNSGEKYDVLLNASQAVGSYWIAVEGSGNCKDSKQLAILRYAGAPSIPAADGNITAPGPVSLNPEFSYCNGSAPNQLCVFQLRTVQPPTKELSMPQGDLRIPLIIDEYNYDVQELFVPGKFKTYFYAPTLKVPFRAMVNNISYASPSSPLISQYNDIPEDDFCQPQCTRAPTCICTYIVKVPLNFVVDVVLAELAPGPVGDGPPPHPFHLHGYHFYVLEQGIFSSDPAAGLKELNRRLDNGEVRNPTAPMKDTITLSLGGYAVIRFVADNPGFWYMHCHFTFHLETGMALVFQVGELSDLPPVPPGFPRCGNFLPSVEWN
ncbi:uncharacterized protein [Rhodnius prolixus]|uniref:uncharacterized protein n=1 Tax=Rhodnius prolixus TaxID=13249 RepID=UPI003D18D7DF